MLLLNISTVSIAQSNLDVIKSPWSSKIWVDGYSTQIQWSKMQFEKGWCQYKFFNGYDAKMHICWTENTGFHGCKDIAPKSEDSWTACNPDKKIIITITKIELEKSTPHKPHK